MIVRPALVGDAALALGQQREEIGPPPARDEVGQLLQLRLGGGHARQDSGREEGVKVNGRTARRALPEAALLPS